MSVQNYRALFGKLNHTCHNALEAATKLCDIRTHYNVEIEHLFLTLSEVLDTDLQRLLRHYEIDPGQLARDLTRALERFKTVNARGESGLSSRIPQLVSEAWMLASIDYGAISVRSGHLLLALLSNADLARLARESSVEFQKIAAEDLH